LTKLALFAAEMHRDLRSDFGLSPNTTPLDLARRANRLRWIAERLCGLHGIDVRLDGHVPPGPCVLVANHVGYFDPMAITAHIACVAVAKRQVSRWPVIGEVLRRLGTVFVDRRCAYDGARALRRLGRALDRGVPILVFPEGTTSRGDAVGPLQRGAFGLAVRRGATVVPIAIRYDDPADAWLDEDFVAPHALRTTVDRTDRSRTRVQLRVGPTITPSPGDDPHVLAARARHHLSRLIAEPSR
jgi:1-acyl-sn-glycerol-3-phosphate acyltransferase